MCLMFGAQEANFEQIRCLRRGGRRREEMGYATQDW